MTIQKRFIVYLLALFGLWIVLIGITIPVYLEVILPTLAFGSEWLAWTPLLLIGIVTVGCLLLFGWFFGSPLLLMMKWIHQLAQKDYSKFIGQDQLYTSKGTLKIRYRLYQEVFTQLVDMRCQLKKAGIERAEVETEKRDWMAGISHDLKTPLTYMKGYSTLLLNSDYHWSDDEQHQFIQQIDEKAEHMEQLVEDLNLFIRLDGSQTVPIQLSTQNIVKIVQRVIADMSNYSEASHHHFELQTEKKAIHIECDAGLLMRAFQNIYMNSILHNESAVQIETSIHKRKDHVLIQIKDDGIGMTEETKQHIFRRYYRGTATDESSEGTGLGMAIVKQLITVHGGTIQVESAWQQGTAFTITLPME